MNYIYDLGWVFIYISVFGLSELIVKKYIKTFHISILYYFFFGIIGFILLYQRIIAS